MPSSAKRKIPSNVKRKLQNVAKRLKKSITFIGCFSYLDNFVIKAKEFSFFLACKFNIVCFYVTKKTFEILDPLGFINTMKTLRSETLCKLMSFAQTKKILCNVKSKNVCPSMFEAFIKLRDSGISFVTAIKKLI